MSNCHKLENILDWTDGTTAFKDTLLEKAEKYQQILIFGAGIGGKMVYDFLSEHSQEHKVIYFSDNNKNKTGGSYLGKPVILPEQIVFGNDMLILVSSTAFDVIYKQLVKLGADGKNICYCQPAGFHLKNSSDRDFIRENIQLFENIYEKLADLKSRKIFRCLLNYRISKNISYLEEMKDVVDSEENQYFDADLLAGYEFSKGFIDAGAYHGDTVRSFYRHFPEYKGNYYCLEAGQTSYKRLCASIAETTQENIYTYQCAVWNEKGSLKFDTASFGDGGGSRVSDKGETVYCDALDNLFLDKPVDFIKMDIEGAEKRALLGAKKIIQKNNPILAICIYHKQEDFFDIPMTIEDITGEGYEFYVRQYRYGQSETVLYAMPKSRMKK